MGDHLLRSTSNPSFAILGHMESWETVHAVIDALRGGHGLRLTQSDVR